MTEFIINTDSLNRCGAFFTECCTYCLTKSADNVMLLNRDNPACFLCRCDNKLFIKRFDCCYVDNFCTYTFFSKCLACLNCLCNHKTVGYNCNVCTFCYDLTFTDFKLVIVTMEYRNGKSAESEINRPVIFISSFDRLLCLNVISRTDYNHTRNGTHKRKILTALM